MRSNRTLCTLLITMLLVISLNFLTVKGQVGAAPTIEDPNIKIENGTEEFHLLFEVDGTAPAGTDHVNLTFGFENSTTMEILPFWIEPMDKNLFFVGAKLIPTGSERDPWSEWKFKAYANIPNGGDILATLEFLAPILGIELPDIDDLEDPEEIQNLIELTGTGDLLNLSEVDNIEDLFDMEVLLEIFLDTEILVIAAAHDGEGNVTTGEMDIKMDLINAVFEFLADEGYVEEPVSDDTVDDEVSEREDSTNKVSWVWVIVLVTGSVLILVTILILVLMLVIRNGKN